MTALRVLAALVAVVFFVQLAAAGVQRRDAPAAAGGASSDALSDLLQSLSAAAESLRDQVRGLASNSSASGVFEELGNHVTALQARLGEVANNFTQHISGGGAAAH